MATKRMDVSPSHAAVPDTGVYQDLVSNQITSATAPSVGNVLAWVLVDGADLGWKDRFSIPKDYVGSPVLVVRGILDGTPGASEVLGFGLRKRAVAANESADGTFDAEEAGSATIGSGGVGYADEDEFEITITLTAGDYAVDDSVYFHFYIDASATTYGGNVLITSLHLEYADA